MPGDHICPSCFKTYQRHDLLQRHRRRCLRPKKSTRRKACDACVQAKSKCTYTHPCARCVDRGVSCVYASGSADAQLGPSNDNAFSPLSTPSFTLIQPPVLQLPTQGITDFGATDGPGPGPVDLIRIVEQYPKCLLRDDYTSPFLHCSLYEQDVPNMTTLARTSMAVCCGSAMETADGARFARQAMEVERQRLIQTYPTYTCMQQWDALHAMLVYAILELRASNSRSGEEWKQRSYSTGLKAPFLAKMAQTLIRSHMHDLNTDLMSVTMPMGSQKLEHWAVAETTRRTIFLANIVHFLGHCDPESGSPSLYYEPLDDEMILNMPLPSSHVLWATRSEMDWELNMDYCEQNSLTMADTSSSFNTVLGCLNLKQVLESYPRDYLQTLLISNIGVGGSDELRNLIILCALQQFT
ncbi:hypothetical protein N7481_010092 [Penicillium waksmanii]|uniref:uncharacterized protein n=1 Tax=Penicillium waksmanii TaxID=69791 RepID=UPI0025499917|nr:uncharacterized protein N7481_010092 [Penicillium waksmanii]KAJ5976385.1 hypothetical protein N7481_010092 [Penicillium waksmanii]